MTTFVTSFIDLNTTEDRPLNRDTNFYIKKGKELRHSFIKSNGRADTIIRGCQGRNLYRSSRNFRKVQGCCCSQ